MLIWDFGLLQNLQTTTDAKDSWNLPMSTIEYPMALISFCGSLKPNFAVNWRVFTVEEPSSSSNDEFSSFLLLTPVLITEFLCPLGVEKHVGSKFEKSCAISISCFLMPVKTLSLTLPQCFSSALYRRHDLHEAR